MNRTLVVLALGAFASAASMRVTDALLPRFAQTFGVGLANASLSITAFAVAYGIMQLPFGPLGDRFGKLRVISAASAGAAAASVACFLAPGFGTLIAARIAAGGFCACMIPLAMAWIGDVVPYGERQPVLARFLIGQILGLASGAAVGGFAAESADWRWPFAILAVWLAASSAAVGWQARSDPAPRAPGNRFFRDLAGVLSAPWARIVVATVFVEGTVVFGALAFIPTHLHLERGAEMSHAGLTLLAFGAGGVGFAIGARRALKRLGEAGLALGGGLLLSAGLATLAGAPAAAAWAGCLAAGLGFYMLHNTLQTNATQMAPERRGAAMALFASSFFLGQSTGVALAGVLAQRAGTTALIAAGSLLILPIGGGFAALVRAHRKQDIA